MAQGSDGTAGTTPHEDEAPADSAPSPKTEPEGGSEKDKAEKEIEAGDIADELADFA